MMPSQEESTMSFTTNWSVRWFSSRTTSKSTRDMYAEADQSRSWVDASRQCAHLFHEFHGQTHSLFGCDLVRREIGSSPHWYSKNGQFKSPLTHRADADHARWTKSLRRNLVASGDSGPGRRGVSDNSERGASLILALIFLIVVSLIVISLATWTSNGLNNTRSFTAAQSTISAANSATELAAQYARYNFVSSTLDASPPASCWASSSKVSYNGVPVSVWCSTLWFPSSTSQTRIVTFSTCLQSVSPANCAAAPLLQAVVYYDDFPQIGGSSNCLSGTLQTSSTTCGVGMAIHSWVFVPTPPTVSKILVGSITAPCTTTKAFTLYGTGFSSAAKIYFIVPPIGSNQVYAAGQVTFVSSGQLTACEPTTGSGSPLIIVTTETGTSQAYTPSPAITFP